MASVTVPRVEAAGGSRSLVLGLSLHCGDGQQRVVDFCPICRAGPMSQQLLDGDPVVQDLAAPFLHAPSMTQLQDGGGHL